MQSMNKTMKGKIVLAPDMLTETRRISGTRHVMESTYHSLEKSLVRLPFFFSVFGWKSEDSEHPHNK